MSSIHRTPDGSYDPEFMGEIDDEHESEAIESGKHHIPSWLKNMLSPDPEPNPYHRRTT